MDKKYLEVDVKNYAKQGLAFRVVVVKRGIF